jgi:hypothetical protein
MVGSDVISFVRGVTGAQRQDLQFGSTGTAGGEGTTAATRQPEQKESRREDARSIDATTRSPAGNRKPAVWSSQTFGDLDDDGLGDLTPSHIPAEWSAKLI